MTVTDRPRSRWRRVASWVFVVLAAVAVMGSVIGFWVHRTVLDTDEFMEVVTPIVESESVRAVVADRVGDQILEALSLETRLAERLTQTEERLLDRLAEALELSDAVVARLQNTRLGLDALAPVIAAGVEARVREAVSEFVSSPEGTRILLQTIEVAHERSVLLLRDELEQLPNVVVADGEVRLNLVPVLAEVLRSLVNAGLDVIGIQREIPPFDSSEDASAAVARLASVVGRDLPPDFGQVRIASEASLERAQGLIRAFDLALWVLVIVAVTLGFIAVWLAPSIPVGVVRIGMAATIAVLAGWLLVQVVSAQIAEAAATADGRAAAGDIVRALVNGLSGTALALAIIGIGVVIAGIVADRPRPVAVTVSGGGGPAPQPGPSAVTSPDPVSAAPAKPRRPTSRKASAAKTTSAKGPAAKPAATSGDAPTKKRRRPPAAGA